MNRMIDLSDGCSRCIVCAQLMHKKNTSKDCDRRDNNNHNHNHNHNQNFICVFECTIVNLSTDRQFTKAAWIGLFTKKKRKEIKIALNLGYPISYFYNKRCNIFL